MKEKRQYMRAGHRYFARCEHGDAAKSYRHVVEMEKQGDAAYSELAGRLVTIAESDHKTLTRRLEVIRGAFEGADLLRSIKEIDRARVRFSAAKPLRDLRQEVVSAIQDRYRDVVALSSKLVKETRFADAKLVAALRTKVVEAAYNFHGIEPQRIEDQWHIVVFSLLFYVLYTIWYGYGLMFLFEGLGLQLTD